ncbi:invasion associated locus B family protein [Rhodobacteraceae bacterium 2376]|uniref:Invasion associated locus B family protein n=1 Tax=Rhabdonatronobacter sediminivivens TaxID=2743469 RepID=A0A7Z0KYJ5_9RHOB|nr:invasion associated locus B family protein [Rhabdonatronobacter sediminivivens]NYS25265.1 invasion associated locus B family protein [Rhabdonatronobacter sediminivivens]
MARTASALTFAIVAAMGLSAHAQDTETDPGLSMGDEIGVDTGALDPGGMGESYLDETFQDWERVCVSNPDGEDPCQMYQLLMDDTENSVAEISIFPLPEGQEAAAGATFLAPLETLLTADLVLRIDGGEPRAYPFSFCSAMGCVARVGFTAAEIERMKRGTEATWRLIPAAAPDQEVVATMSLMGFTAAFDSLGQ